MKAMRRELSIEFTVSRRLIRRLLAVVLFMGVPLELDSATPTDSLDMSYTFPSPATTYSRLITSGNSGSTVLNKYGGSTYLVPGKLPDGSPANPSGRVGIGTSSPAQKLDVAGDVRVSGYADLGGAAPNNVYFGNGAAWGYQSSGSDLAAKPNTGAFQVLDPAGAVLAEFGPNSFPNSPSSQRGAKINGNLEVTGSIRACEWMSYTVRTDGNKSSTAKTYCTDNGAGNAGKWYVLHVQNFYGTGVLPVTGNMMCCRIITDTDYP